MAQQVWYESLVGEGQGQTVRVLIEVVGPQRDNSEMSNLTRREMCHGLVSDVARAAHSYGVQLQPTGETLASAKDRF